VARRLKREGDDDFLEEPGDFAIELNPLPDPQAPTAPKKKKKKKRPKPPPEPDDTEGTPNMAVSGVASAKPNLMIQLEDGQVVELQPGWSQAPEGSIVVDDQPKVIVSSATAAPRVTAPMSFAEPRSRRSGLWLVVLVYLAAGAALVAAIYERFLA
jgi:hypothetical protein